MIEQVRGVARVRPSNPGSRAFLRIGTELNEATRPLQHGATTPKISIWSCRTTLGKRYFASGEQTELGTKAAKGAGVGGAIGGTVGAIAAAIAAVGTSIAIPGLGLVVAGPLAAALAGAGAGGAAGGLVGALIGAGIPEERVKHYEQGIKEGGILMGVRPRTEEDAGYFESEWSKAGGTHVYR